MNTTKVREMVTSFTTDSLFYVYENGQDEEPTIYDIRERRSRKVNPQDKPALDPTNDWTTRYTVEQISPFGKNSEIVRVVGEPKRSDIIRMYQEAGLCTFDTKEDGCVLVEAKGGEA